MLRLTHKTTSQQGSERVGAPGGPHRGPQRVSMQAVRRHPGRCWAEDGAGGKGVEATSSALNGDDKDTAYAKGGEFLRSVGFKNQAEVARVLDIAMNPNSLFVTFRDRKRAANANARQLSVEEDMKPVVRYLQTLDLTQEDIIKIISDHPPILSYSVEAHIQRLVDYLATIGIENPVRVIQRRPSLLGLDVDDNLAKIVEYLKANDYTDEQIILLLEESI
eukprot:evm.model.scf_828EXC.4 EVM.evm.TU.scf_828EXC.4   scf_828EXC:28858-30682(+)